MEKIWVIYTYKNQLSGNRAVSFTSEDDAKAWIDGRNEDIKIVDIAYSVNE
jgi:hypothetical protein